MQEEFKYADITRRIIGCALRVHKYFGLGFKEEVYEKSLLMELRKEGLKCSSQQTEDIYYHEQLVGQARLDILVEDKVLLELKAVSELDKACYNRIMNYLKVFKIDVGLLLNFGRQSLEFKRFTRF